MPRDATSDDALTIGRLLYAFNREYDDPTPEPEALAERLRELLAGGDTRVVLADDDAGVAVLRLRPSLWSRALEAYLAELYIVPERRGQGLGRAAMEIVEGIARERGHSNIELNVFGGNETARSLYRALGYGEEAVVMSKRV